MSPEKRTTSLPSNSMNRWFFHIVFAAVPLYSVVATLPLTIENFKLERRVAQWHVLKLVGRGLVYLI